MTPIEYIGPAPKKKRKKPVLGGWVITLLAGLFVTYFAWPSFAEYLRNENDKPSAKQTQETISELKTKGNFGDKLAAAALERTQAGISYDDAVYNNIGYPNGDVPADRGNNADMIIRAYRSLDIDLQQLVHEDMKENFYDYPQLWNSKQPDHNIDHRRVPNLQRFFERHGKSLEISKKKSDYAHGDIIIWRTPSGRSHIGILAPGPGKHGEEQWVIHNNSNSAEGPEWNNQLFDYTITGHFRYHGK